VRPTEKWAEGVTHEYGDQAAVIGRPREVLRCRTLVGSFRERIKFKEGKSEREQFGVC
jgi:hypothetical protein